MNYIKRFRVEPGSKVDLAKIDAGFKDKHESHEQALPEIEAYNQKLHDLQYLMYAEGKRSLLICLQGRDAAGKDGTINHVLGAMNPQGCTVTGFKVPSKEEAAHDFLWRYHQHTPGKGQVAIFNRSHYEDVLVVRVHDLVPKQVWSQRYEQINAFERMLADEGTTILKFFLHISKAEQAERLQARLDTPHKRWKLTDEDWRNREKWVDYERAVNDMVQHTSTLHAPWTLVEGNDKRFARVKVIRTLCEQLESALNRL